MLEGIPEGCARILSDTQSLYSGPADNFPLPGVYFDEDASGFEVDQNVLWNNEANNIFLNGSNLGSTDANNNYVHNNTIPDISSTGFIWISDIVNCGTTQIVNNLVFVPVTQTGTNPPCTANNNGYTAIGATDMTVSVQVGCDFAGCASDRPPGISGASVAASISVQPCSVTVSAGQSATFTVRGAGSAPLNYQWQKNGVNIPGAVSASYTTPKNVAADGGAAFTVQVTNVLGSVTSTGAMLAVD